jgi:transcriptional regulator GlxA family with amidase domain
VNQMTKTVGIYLFDDVEVLDFSGPFEVFTTASRVKAKITPESANPFNVVTLALSRQPITTRGGLVVVPQFDLASHTVLDVTIIPGGVVTAELEKMEVIEWVRAVDKTTEITASVCTGAFILAKAGLLDDLPVTTHWEDQTDLQSMYPRTCVLPGKRWVDNGHIVTSAGISAGIGMSLHLVARLEGLDLAKRTARQMEIDWDPE